MLPATRLVNRAARATLSRLRCISAAMSGQTPPAAAARSPPSGARAGRRRLVMRAAAETQQEQPGEEGIRWVDSSDMIKGAYALVPTYTKDTHKGQHGKVCVVGGCREYTGAPYFAAMSALRVGADLAHVICTPGAAPVIKGYSPELIVLPFLPEEDAPADAAALEALAAKVRPWLGRISVLVVGPGLGDDPAVVSMARIIMKEARAARLPLLVDGSGLNIVAQDPDLVRGYDRCILTPNLPEFGRLAAGVGLQLDGAIGPQWQDQAGDLAAAFDGPVVLSKGPVDAMTNTVIWAECEDSSSKRRAGGQGDILAGAVSAFMCWAFPRSPGGGGGGDGGDGRAALMHAAYGGCAVVRRAAWRAGSEKGRSMLAGDIIPCLADAFKVYFKERPDPSELQPGSTHQ
ncbi:MAG: Ribokinase-like protein [Monoraphidium minutum]|nr:MAG: Ribokinase-like protein [Monoraphidium minutum]